MLRMLRSLFFAAVFTSLVVQSLLAETKNVILMVSDGAGFNCYDAVSMYLGRWDAARQRSTQVYDGPGWIKRACSTFPLNTSKTPTGTGKQDPDVVYDPAKAWNPEQGYAWLKSGYTDSAAAATAMSTGQKTFNNAINWSDLGEPIKPTMTELAKSLGKSAGVVSTVPWSHATPAGLSNAHVAERDDYESIAAQMLEGGVLDVIMGAGNPDFTNNGTPWQDKKPAAKKPQKKAAKPEVKPAAKAKEDTRTYKYVGGQETWKAIETARRQPQGTYQGFRPVSTKAEFEALLTGKTPAKVLGTAQVATTLQQARTKNLSQNEPVPGASGRSETGSGIGSKADTDDPALDTPLNSNVPTLATMVQGAIRVLSANPKGFFLLVEGGAVDWANHGNQPGRMIQEQTDFCRAVEAVVQWVETHSNWDETLLIVTGDHETGLLWGPNSDTKPFDPLVNNGPGKIPGLKYNHKSHSNSLVPVYARGAGSQLLDTLIVGTDPVRGPYVDNTGVSKVLRRALGETKGP